MVVVGIVPGLLCLEYVILSWDGRLARYHDADTSRAWPADTREEPEAGRARRARFHRLILSVIVERAEPDVLVGLGPPYSRHESPAEVDAVRGVIEDLVQTAGGRTASWDTSPILWDALSELADERVHARNLRRVVEGFLRDPLPGSRRPTAEATAAALLAAHWATSS